MLRLASRDASGCATFDPGGSEDEEKVTELTESEHCTAEYQAERSTDVTHQSQRRIRLYSFNVGVLQLRKIYLHDNENVTKVSHQIKLQHWQNKFLQV